MKLCINADDYLIHERITTGIREAIEAGAVTSVSVMGDADFDSSLGWLRGSKVSAGLHLTLTSKGNRFLPQLEGPRGILKAGLTGGLPAILIEKELAGQYSRFVAAYGDRPSHLDCHEHIHAWPSIRRVVSNIAAKNRIPYVRTPRDYSPGISAKKLALTAAFPRNKGQIAFFGINLMGRAFTWPNIKQQFAYLKKKGVERALWVVHAGYQGPERIAGRPDYPHREEELAVLLKHIARIGEFAEIVSMEDLLQGA